MKAAILFRNDILCIEVETAISVVDAESISSMAVVNTVNQHGLEMNVNTVNQHGLEMNVNTVNQHGLEMNVNKKRSIPALKLIKNHYLCIYTPLFPWAEFKSLPTLLICIVFYTV